MTSFPRGSGSVSLLLRLLAITSLASSFQSIQPFLSAAGRSVNSGVRYATKLEVNDGGKSMESDVDEYRNAPTAFLANFMQSKSKAENEDAPIEDPLAGIDFSAPKSPKLKLETLAGVLDWELTEREWFVTGDVNPVYFSDDFQFQDPDVKVTGIEEYARGVRKLFDETSRAQIISSEVSDTVPNTITITWRLSGRVNIGPKGLPIKPYICYTDFTVDEDTGLITFQEDRFDIPGWDILLSALFPFLIGKVTSEPAPEVEPRVVNVPPELNENRPLEFWKKIKVF